MKNSSDYPIFIEIHLLLELRELNSTLAADGDDYVASNGVLIAL